MAIIVDKKEDVEKFKDFKVEGSNVKATSQPN